MTPMPLPPAAWFLAGAVTGALLVAVVAGAVERRLARELDRVRRQLEQHVAVAEAFRRRRIQRAKPRARYVGETGEDLEALER